MKNEKDIEIFSLAFKLGFMVSREGFNGECVFDHLAPDDVEPDDGRIEYFLNYIGKSEEFGKLEKQAIEKFLK